MKTKLILGSLLAFVTIGNSQIYTPGGVIQGPSGNSNVAIGGSANSAPSFKLEVISAATNDGINVNQTGFGAAALHLNNQTTGGHDWSFMSSGAGNTQGAGNLFLLDWTTAKTPLFIEGATGNVEIGTSSTPVFIDGATGNVGIGNITPSAELHVVGGQSVIRGDAATTFGATGVEGNGTGTSASAGFAYGFRGVSTGGLGNYGAFFQATGNNSSTRTAMGVLASVTSVGLGSANYGIYATVNGVHHSGNGPDYAGYFDGDVVTAGGFYFYSDKRLKKDIVTISNSLNIINRLNPVNYAFDTEANPYITLPSEKQYGFLSQEIQGILPELTKTVIHPAKIDREGKEIAPKQEILGLNYTGFIALLTKGMQEQQAQILDQQKQLDDQKQQIDALTQKSSGTTGINSINTVETGFQMSQNEPNPFTHETVVKYTLPQTISNAFMAVYDLTGKQITTFPINEKGSSSLTITSEKLAAGIYIYSIVADGKVIDSKRMIVAEK